MKLQITHAPSSRWICPEYSTVCPWNADGSRLLLIAVDHFQLYSLSDAGYYKLLMDLPIDANQEPRWSRTDPSRFYYVADNALMVLVLGHTGEVTAQYAQHVFPEYQRISGMSEGDVAQNDIGFSSDEYIVLAGINGSSIEVFLYNITDDQKFPPVRQSSFDSIKLSPGGKIVLARDTGLYYLQADSRLTEVNGHAAVANFDNRDVLIWCTNGLRQNWHNSVELIDIERPLERRVLINFGQKNYATHISTCDKSFCLVSVFDPTEKLPMQLWKVPYIGSPVLIEETAIKYRGYTSQPKATLNRNGSLAAYSIDDGSSVNTWIIDVEPEPLPEPVPVEPTETRIDYSQFVGQEFIMRPRPDGAVDIFQRKSSK